MAVFGLKKIYLNQVENNYQNYEQETVSSYGYLSGGQGNPGPGYLTYSNIQRLEFDTQTLTQIGSKTLQGNAYFQNAVFNSDYSFISGGNIPGPTISCVIDRFDYSNETLQNPGNPLASFSSSGSNLMTNDFGLFAGGNPGIVTVKKIEFSNETTSLPGNNLTLGRADTGEGSSASYGYVIQGYSTLPGRTCTIERISFSDETVSATPNSIRIRNAIGSVQTPSSAYTAGGAVPAVTCVIERLDFASESTVDNTGGFLSVARRYVGGLQDSKYGYYCGGTDPVQSTTIDRLDFGTETVDIGNTTLPYISGKFACFEGGSKITRGKPRFESTQRKIANNQYGYIAGGILETTPGYITKTNFTKIEFSTDLNTDLSATLSNTEPSGTSSVSSRDYGYFGGGYFIPGPFTVVCTVDRLDFSSESASTPGLGLTQNAAYSATIQTTSFGYFIAGQTSSPAATCLITRIDFTSETSTQQGFTTTLKRLSGAENQLYGYVFGSGPGSISNIYRYDFVNETNGVIPALTTYASQQTSSTGNNEFGYFHLGFTSVDTSIVNRFDFANETIKSSNNLPREARNVGSLNSNTSGYYVGGYISPPTTYYTSISKLDFDSETHMSSGNLATYGGRLTAGVEGKYELTQTNYNTVPESVSYGYYAGGTGSASTVERLDNATETFSSPTNKRQVTNNSIGNGAENSQYGYYFGGYSSNPTSTIEKLDFTSEVFGVSISNLTVSSNRSASAYTNDYAYVFGNYLPPVTSPYTTKTSIDRFEYINETIDTSTRMNSEPREGMMGTQSSYFGYAAGGSMNPPSLGVSRVDKLDFTTEITSVITDSLSYNRRLGGTIQNKNFGYFGGGQTTPSIGNRSAVERIDFTTETVSHPGNYDLPQSRQAIGGSENLQYGYFVGGYTSTEHSTVERFEFETETMSVPGNPTVSPMNTSSQGLNGGSALRQVGKNNRNDSRAGLDNQGRNVGSSYGYSIGASPNRYEVDRLDFLNETYFALNNSGSPAPFGASSQGAAVSNKSFGYYTAHQVPSGPLDRSIVARLDFTNDSWIDTPTIMTYLTHRAGTTYNNNYGYIAGGEHPSDTDYSFINRLDFETESMNLLTATLSQGRERLQGGVMRDNALNYGYFMGGYAAISTVDRLDFNTESIAVSTNLPQGQTFMSAYSYSKSNLGYYVGGVYPGAIQSDIIRFDFTTETYTDTGNDSSLNMYGMNTTQNDNYGYGTMGGNPSGTDDTERIEFVTETASSPGATVNTSGSNGTGMSN